MDYAGFWVRVLAYLIDFVILAIGEAVVSLFGEVIGVIGISDSAAFSTLEATIGLIGGLIYFAAFEASARQATPGKMAMGLIVTDATGERISAARAIGRYFAKYLSAIILLIGFIMVAFTERNQGLHDLLASTFVVKGVPGTVGLDA